MTRNNAVPDILLVEDNQGDVRLTQEAFQDAKFEVRLHTVSDGVEAVDFLKSNESPCPDLVLLDLNLPRKDGFDVLEAIRADSDLERLPVLVLTSSTTEDDVISAYEQHANAYLTKPDNPAAFTELVRTVENFWMETARLPPC